ncbi:hypothetical protein J7E73_24510 [Paenibacillus albidus]|uniref:hypothetical protein n=1 Tax=Paenibacillus albidus TaxID=2041023 RepID=UPI001BE90A88|nr:hypothetical protein [Paenibacillus albidus]MBT2292236.1 hypothetical protein [Paenibacillus albidus]
MNEICALTDELRRWSDEMLLRGWSQLGPDDLERLIRDRDTAALLQMDFLSRLLQNLADQGRQLLLGGGGEEELQRCFFRLCQYVMLAEEGIDQ